MREPKHTPGDWYIDGRDETGLRIMGPHPKGSERKRVVAVAVFAEGTWTDEGEANAELIAAAPRLAEALKDLLKLHDSGVFIANAWNAAMEDARAALREAGMED